MDSLLRLCARHIVAQHPLPTLPADLYPVLFELAFLDGRPLVLRDLVATWPYPELHFLLLVGHLEIFQVCDCTLCIEAIIQGVVLHIRPELEEPGSDSSGFQLHVVDMTGVPDDPFGLRISLTQALATACVEVSKHQKELQRHRRKRHKGCSGATTTAPQLPLVDIHTDLLVERSFYRILCEALQTGATGPLRIKCREFQARELSTIEIVTLLKSLDPSCLRRVHLQFVSFGLDRLSEIMPQLSRFPELHSLMIQLDRMDLRRLTPESATRIRAVAAQLGMLPGLRELSLGMIKVSGNLDQFLWNTDIPSFDQESLWPHLSLFPPASYLKAPLESLDLDSCSLVPDDLTFLSQSLHASALKKSNLSNNDISRGLLEPLRLLLEKASASLLYLDLSYCHIADSHLAVLLPTLLRCSRLRFLRLYGNSLSTAALKDLLQKTLELPELYQVLYPIPVDFRGLEPSDFGRNFVTDEERLVAAKAEFSQILANSGRTDLIWTDDPEALKAMDYFSL